MVDDLKNNSISNICEKGGVNEEEFFEQALFDDVLEMKSLKQVSDMAAADLKLLQEKAYRCLFNLYQKERGITMTENEKDEVFGIFEIFFRNYYQHFRSAMEELIKVRSPIKVAYFLGKNSDKMHAMLAQVIKEIEKEIL